MIHVSSSHIKSMNYLKLVVIALLFEIKIRLSVEWKYDIYVSHNPLCCNIPYAVFWYCSLFQNPLRYFLHLLLIYEFNVIKLKSGCFFLATLSLTHEKKKNLITKNLKWPRWFVKMFLNSNTSILSNTCQQFC